MTNKTELSLIIPTYNEKENIQVLLDKLFSILKQNKINGEIIIVDDNSPDETGKVVEDLKKKHRNLRIIHRPGKLGLSSAVLEGFSVANGDVLAVMDADLSHPAEKIPEMLDIIRKNEADFVIGSRYIKEGKIEGWNIKRLAMSKGAILLSRVFTPVKDTMSGFFMIKKQCIQNKELNPKGFKILLELIIKADYKNINEIPITFVNRTKGESKAGIKEIFYYLNNLIHYLPYKKNVIQEFFKFAFVGVVGMIVNLFILYSFTEFFGVYYLISAIFAFIIAATSNFFFNKVWTFREKINDNLSKKYIQFFLVSLVALIVNLFFLYILTEFFGIYYITSQFISIAIAFSINFLGNKIWTFNK
ncbi:MAG: glycosyltransferase family 2 protein [archaeon]|nr:glycosyltransferase family 2 protein [archaeon]